MSTKRRRLSSITIWWTKRSWEIIIKKYRARMKKSTSQKLYYSWVQYERHTKCHFLWSEMNFKRRKENTTFNIFMIILMITHHHNHYQPINRVLLIFQTITELQEKEDESLNSWRVNVNEERRQIKIKLILMNTRKQMKKAIIKLLNLKLTQTKKVKIGRLILIR